MKNVTVTTHSYMLQRWKPPARYRITVLTKYDLVDITVDNCKHKINCTHRVTFQRKTKVKNPQRSPAKVD